MAYKLQDGPLSQDGISFVVNWGESGGFYIRFSSVAWRVCLWRFAVTLYWTADVDYYISAGVTYIAKATVMEVEA